MATAQQFKENIQRILDALGLGCGLALGFVLLLALQGQPVHADPGGTYCVVPVGETPGPFAACAQVFTSIQQAVDAASAGQEIRVAGGIYTDVHQRTGVTQTVYMDQDVTLRGGYLAPFDAPPDPTSSPTTLAPQDLGRAVYVAAAGASVTLENLSLSGFTSVRQPGSSVDGGSIYNAGTLILSNITVTDSVAEGGEGGGIYNAGTLTMTHSTVQDSSTGALFGSGGGVYNAGTLTMLYCTVRDNGTFEAAGGGGIYNAGQMAIAHSRVQGNGNVGFFGPGGGIYNAGSLHITYSTIRGNRGDSPGGGIANGGTLTIDHSTISGNRGAWGGGGIENHGVLTITNTTISANTSVAGALEPIPGRGAGILNQAAGALALNYVTLVGNTADLADSDGGGIYNSGQARFRGAIVAGNVAQGVDDDCYSDGALVSLGFNLVGSGAGCPRVSTDQAVDPADVFVTVLGPLQDNTGSTYTHALLSESPAIDAAKDSHCPPLDQRGWPRPVDGNDDGSAICDIGAFERQELFQSYMPLMRKH